MLASYAPFDKKLLSRLSFSFHFDTYTFTLMPNLVVIYLKFVYFLIQVNNISLYCRHAAVFPQQKSSQSAGDTVWLTAINPIQQ